MAAFQLSKWYLDCVTDTGETLIAYTGAAHWGAVHLSYSALLEAGINGVTARHTFSAQDEPAINGDSILWRCDALHIEGLWQSDSPALRETLFNCEQGSVEWHCLMPRARVRCGDRVGLGYAEHLSMTIPPWKLPIDELRWGRFASASDWAVWIDWLGESSRRKVYVNGDPATTAALEDNRIVLADGTALTMDCSLVLRDGPLGKTTLSAVPGIRRTFPTRFLRISERKWRSRGRLEKRDGSIVEGWAIHEIVRWPR